MRIGKRSFWHTELKDKFIFFFKPKSLSNEENDANFATKRIRDKLDSIHEKIGIS